MNPGPQYLLQAMGSARRKATDPRLEALQALTGAAHGAAQLPAPGSEDAAPAPADPAIALQHAFAAYLKQSGRTQDPLAARIGQQGAHTGLGTPDPIKLLQTAGQPFHQVTHGSNAGQMAQSYDLGNGKVANVYYRNGKRQVRVYTP